MKSIGIIATVICVSALGCSLLNMIAPQGNTRRILSTVIGAFLLCSMLMPIKNALSDLKVNISVVQPSEDLVITANEAYNEAIIVETKNTLESALIAYMNQNGIKVSDVNIELAGYENGGIYIDSITVYIPEQQRNSVDNVIKLTEKKFEIEPKVILR